MIKSTHRFQQNGLSLVELLVVIIIGIFITLGVTSVYVGNKKTSMTTDELSLLQANGRDVLEQLTQVIQHAGYKSTRSPLGPDMFITGPVASSSCADGSDSVANTTILLPTQNNVTNGIFDSDTIGVVYLGDDLLTTDCTGEEISTACALSETSAAPTAAARIYNHFRTERNANGIPVLTCGGSISGVREELAEGVENLQIMYGEDADSDGIPDRFVNSNDVTNWGSIVSVNVAVLVRSLRPVAPIASTQKYQLLDGINILTNDKYLRSVFTTTIRLRNATS